MRRLPTLLLLLAVGACAPSESEPTPEAILADAAAYLWSQQAEDGGWHSTTHGLLRGGQAWTPFVLHSLLQVPDSIVAQPQGGVDRALTFLRAHINADGVLGLADSAVLEYPNYATAYALRIFAEHGAPEDSALVRRMVAYLRGQQFTEQRGITPDRLAYGAWGFGETTLAQGEAGHLDLSHTRRAVQALRAAEALDDEAAVAVTRYLRLVQKHPAESRAQPPSATLPDSAQYDGGFYASPTVQGVNKGWLTEAGVYRSYATATADGILALLAAGHAPDSEPIQAALAWLRAHPDWATPAGIPTDGPIAWDRVMHFYHLAARAEAYDALGEPGWHDEVLRVLAAQQHTDGHFANPEGAPNKEDDPLLATAMMVDALVRLLSAHLGGS
ncbi:MAG: hypothetical protein HKN04_10350 [Rhodothermaceae bacterium]|nr:hypothetical protein [Rhodothermaceae bacterium]